VKTDIDPFAIFFPPILTLIVIALGYSQSRSIRGGKPLSSIQRKLMFYMPAFVLGMGYAMAFHEQLAALFRWENAWIAVMVVWGALLAAIAWMRYRCNALSRATATPRNDSPANGDV
jgi:tryptophan-rich sensory protein